MTYRSQSARDAALYSPRYCAYLDAIAQEHADYYTAHGDPARVALQFTRSLSDSLSENDGA